MVAKIILAVIGAAVGGWMVADGVRVLRTGDYFGGRLGPWARVVEFLGFEPYRLGPLFITLGSLWLVGVVLLLVGASTGGFALMTAAVLTLWYLPFGTAASVAALVLLLGFRHDVMS